MLTMLKNWEGTVEVGGQEYSSINDVTSVVFNGAQTVHIILHPKQSTTNLNVVNRENSVSEVADAQQFRITVKQYMTKKASPEFDFMQKWNHDVPMPLRTMTGEKIKETRGMVYMKLHGDIYAERICTCMRCGRQLTNPVSQYFGIGPECGVHNYVNPFNSDEELKEAVSSYKKELQNITWEGWVIKSAIIEEVAL